MVTLASVADAVLAISMVAAGAGALLDDRGRCVVPVADAVLALGMETAWAGANFPNNLGVRGRENRQEQS
jgi:hypothetical protein